MRVSGVELLDSVRGVVSERAGALTRPVLVRAASVKALAVRRMNSARDLSLQRADEAMNTRVGSIAAESLDVGLELAEQLLDTYLPPESSDESITQGLPFLDFILFKCNFYLTIAHNIFQLSQVLVISIKNWERRFFTAAKFI